MPLLLGLGGAALLLGGKKKKKKTTDTGGFDDVGTYTPDPDIEPYIPPDPAPKPAAPDRPAGNPPGGAEYNPTYWGADTDARLISIRQHFADLGFQVEVSAHPMNILGPKGEFELENIDGTLGKLGGDDDKSNDIAKEFQRQYNMISRLNKAEKFVPESMGGLDKDGKVGPYTLNGLIEAKKVTTATAKRWSELVLQATNKGIA